jgi:hypothetical protein
MPHPSFNPAAGEAGKIVGMGRAIRAANPAWLAFIEAAIVAVAKRKPFFFTDDIEQYRLDNNGPTTHELRAMGPAMTRAKRDLVCEPTDHFVPSARKVSHRGPRRVWKSLIYRPR